MRTRPLCDCEPVRGIAAQTPLEAGFSMPAEWSRHEATWLSWPKNPLTFPDEHLEKVEEVYAQMVKALSGGETVRILVDDQALQDRAERVLRRFGPTWSNVKFLQIRSADVWIRDYGPTYLLSKDGRRKAATKWRFNAWGEKYDELMYDDRTGGDVVAWSKVRTFLPGIVLEGGSIDVNGEGTVLTTEQCLLNKNRNPALSREDLEGYLEHFIGSPACHLAEVGHRRRRHGRARGRLRPLRRAEVGAVRLVRQQRWGRTNRCWRPTCASSTGRPINRGSPLEVLKLPMPRPIRAGRGGEVPPGQLCQLLHREQGGAAAGVRGRAGQGRGGAGGVVLPRQGGRPDHGSGPRLWLWWLPLCDAAGPGPQGLKWLANAALAISNFRAEDVLR